MSTETTPRAPKQSLLRRGPVLGIGLGLLIVAAATVALVYARRPVKVWVGPLELKTDNQSGGGLKGSYSFEDGRLLICVYNLDGHYVGALIDNKNQREAIEKELQAVMPDVRRAAAKVAAGWIIPGCAATRAVDREGHGIQAATYQFSPEAKQVVVDPQAIQMMR